MDSISSAFKDLLKKQNYEKEALGNLKCLSNKENFSSESLAERQYVNKSILNESMNNFSVIESNKFLEPNKYLLDNESNKDSILKEIPQNNFGNNTNDQLVSRSELDQASIHYKKREQCIFEKKTDNAQIKDEFQSNLKLHQSTTNEEPNSKEIKLSTQYVISNAEERQQYIQGQNSANHGKVSGITVMKPKRPCKPFKKMTPEEFEKYYASARSVEPNVLANIEEKQKYIQGQKIANHGEVSDGFKKPRMPFSKMTPEEFEKFYNWSRSEEPINKKMDLSTQESVLSNVKVRQKYIQGQKNKNHGKVSGRVMKPKKPFSRMTPEEFEKWYTCERNERTKEFKSSLPDINDTEIDGIILPLANEFGVFELFITDNEHTNVLNGMRKAELPRCRSILLGLNQDINPDNLSPIRDFDGHLIIYFEELVPSKIDWAIKALIKLSPENGLPWNLHLPDCKLELKDIEVFFDCLVKEKINIEGEISIGLDEVDPEELEDFEERIFDNYHQDIEGIVIITPAAYWQEYCGNVFWKGYTQSNFWPFGEDFLKQVAAIKTSSHNFEHTQIFNTVENKFPKVHERSRNIDKEERNLTNEIIGFDSVSVEKKANPYDFGLKCILFHAF